MKWGARRRQTRTSPMAPLDTGTLSPHLRVVDAAGRAAGPAPEDYDTLGAYLRAVRESRGLSIAELAAVTRIRRAHLQALEERNRSALPSRPFAIGYVRSYAKALGVDGESAVQRFKTDWPETDGGLRNPVGVGGEDGVLGHVCLSVRPVGATCTSR